jgi:tight adherence protein B
VAQLFAWSILAAMAGAVGGSALRLGALALLTTAVGLGVPTTLLLLARDRRSRRLSEQLPEALDMMARSLRAGHALTAAFEVVASEMPEPVAVEFGRAFESQKLGLSAERAIAQMTERVPSNRDLKIFAVSSAIQRETGGNMAEILGNIAETIRARYKFYGKLRALTAEGRASAAILGALPIVVSLLLRVVNPGYLVPLFTTPGGHGILALAAALWASGLFWLYRLTQLDV